MRKYTWDPITIQEVFGEAQGCNYHPLTEPYPDDKTETIVGGWTDYGEGWDNESFAIGKLEDGRYLVVMESEDSSGHGCQCSGSSSVHATFEEAMRLGLSQEQRDAAKGLMKERK